MLRKAGLVIFKFEKIALKDCFGENKTILEVYFQSYFKLILQKWKTVESTK